MPLNAVGNLRRRIATLARAWQGVQRDLDEGLLDVAEDIVDAWVGPVAFAVVAGGIVVGLCRLLLSFTAGARPAIAAPSVVLVCATAVACVAGLAWVDIRNRRHNERQGVRFVVGVGISLVAIGVCVEALAGVTTVLWRNDLIAGPADVGPSLWRSEDYYLWHLVNWIPFVDITEGVRWHQPTLFQDSLSGALLFGLKVLLVAPLLRIGIGAYRWVTATLLEDESKWLRRQELRRIASKDQPEWKPQWPRATEYLTGGKRTPLPWVLVILLAASPVAAATIMPLIFQPGEYLDGWWAERVQGIGVMFLRTAPQWIGVVGLVSIIVVALGPLLEDNLWVRDRQGLAKVLVSYAALVCLALVAAAALSLALLHIGVANAEPGIPAARQVRAAIEVQLWHLSSTPGWDMPSTLRWSLRYDFVDGWSGVLFLVVRLFFAGVLVIPVAQAILSFAHFRNRRPEPVTGLGAVTRFSQRFHDAQAAIDRTGDAAGKGSSGTADGTHLGNAAIYAVELVTGELDCIRQLFGRGEVADRADAAVAALLYRLDVVEELRSARFFREGVHAVKREFDRRRAEEQVRYDHYRDALKTALTRAAAG